MRSTRRSTRVTWGTAVDKIVETQPDVVFNTINGDSNVAFLEEYDAKGLSATTIPIVSVSIAEEEAAAIDVDLTGQMTSWNYYQTVESPTNAAFVKAFKAKYGDDRVDLRPDGGGVHVAVAVEGAWSRRPTPSTSTT